jgi:hypothetical protein
VVSVGRDWNGCSFIGFLAGQKERDKLRVRKTRGKETQKL